MHQASQLPDADEIRSSETQRVLESMIRVRPAALPVLVSGFMAWALLQPSEERTLLVAVLAVAAGAISTFDFVRRRAGFPELHVELDLAIGIAIQTFMIATTGLASSPLLMAYLVMTLLAALAMGPCRFYFGLVATVAALAWGMAAIELTGGIPWMFYRPHADLPVDPLVRAAALSFAMLLVTGAGLRLNLAVRRMLERAIEARQQLLRVLSDRNRDLVELSAALSHELKNPLASIQGLVQLLERSPDNREQRFVVLQREIDRMKATLDELLNLSRPIGALTKVPISPEELTQGLSTMAEGFAARRRVKLLPLGEKGPTVRADKKKLEQALHNLLVNAIEASPEGGEVQWVLEETPGAVELGLVDHGPGLTPKVRASIGTIGVTTKPEGSGIGLAVARAIAEQHGGRLILGERAGGGVWARIALPKEDVPKESSP
ncbi:MAG: HAMP domain-containing sensor histidine kinase [Myxococcota bacterium]